MKILLTGGAGFIATHTCVELMEAGHEAVIVDNYVNSQPEAVRRVEEIVGRIQALSEGDRLLLVREPENPYDERAILVQNLEGEKLGYIPRRKNEVLASLMDAGKSIYARVCHLEDPEEDLPVSGYMDIDVYMDD